jgi:hypothetical protein
MRIGYNVKEILTTTPMLNKYTGIVLGICNTRIKALQKMLGQRWFLLTRNFSIST